MGNLITHVRVVNDICEKRPVLVRPAANAQKVGLSIKFQLIRQFQPILVSIVPCGIAPALYCSLSLIPHIRIVKFRISLYPENSVFGNIFVGNSFPIASVYIYNRKLAAIHG